MKSLLIITAIILISCTPQEERSTASISEIPSSEISKLPMKWDASKLPLNVYIADTYHADIDSVYLVAGKNLFQQMMDKWNLADGSRTYFNATSNLSTSNIDASTLDGYIDSTIGIYKKDASWFSNIGGGVLAVTSYLGYNRGTYLEMIHGDIIVNEAYFNYTLNSADTTSAYDLPSVLLHELGHLIGLKHTPSMSIPSVMQPSISGYELKRSLYSYDISSIQSLYNSSFSALSASPLALSADDSDEGKYVMGYIELRSDGKCHHYQNGKLTEIH